MEMKCSFVASFNIRNLNILKETKSIISFMDWRLRLEGLTWLHTEKEFAGKSVALILAGLGDGLLKRDVYLMEEDCLIDCGRFL